MSLSVSQREYYEFELLSSFCSAKEKPFQFSLENILFYFIPMMIHNKIKKNVSYDKTGLLVCNP